jgi:hypothetical protein
MLAAAVLAKEFVPLTIIISTAATATAIPISASSIPSAWY